MSSRLQADGGLEAFREASMEFDAAYSLLAKACGLSDPEFWSLVLINDGVVTQREISEQLSLSRQTLNSAFKLLIRKGLVRLEPLETDQRSKRAILTPAGARFVAKHIVQVSDLEEQAWKTMSPAERAALTSLTRRFAAALRTALQERKQLNSQSSEDL